MGNVNSTRSVEKEEKNKEISKNMKDIWTQIQSFSDFQKAIILFLQGKIGYTPWHTGKMSRESIPYLQILEKINSYGLITIESQPGGEFIRQVEKDDHILGKKGTALVYNQRAFLSGIMKTENIDKFLRSVKEKKLPIAVYTERFDAVNFVGIEKSDVPYKIMNRYSPQSEKILLSWFESDQTHNFVESIYFTPIVVMPGYHTLKSLKKYPDLYYYVKSNCSFVMITSDTKDETFFETIMRILHPIA